MKTTRLLVLLLCLGSGLRASDAANFTFVGVKYQLASVIVSPDGSVTNEYVPEGQTIDAWTTLIGVRHWPQAKKLGDAAQPWLQMVHPLLTQNVGAYKSTGAKNENDIILEAWLSAPDRAYIEINLHRFVLEDGTDGVKAYQYAQKVMMTGGKGDPTAFVKGRAAIFDALSQLKLPLHLKQE